MNRIKQIFSLLAFTGGMISFNGIAADCPAGLKIPPSTYKPYYGSRLDYFINLNGCEYKALGTTLLPNTGSGSGEIWASEGFISTGNQVKPGVPPSVNTDNNPSDKPDNPGDSGSTGGGTTVTPPPSGGSSGSSGGGSGSGSILSDQLKFISSSSTDSLYRSFQPVYVVSESWEKNLAVAQAFLGKLSDAVPPDYRSVDRIKSVMEVWQDKYLYMRPNDSGVFPLWNSNYFVEGQHMYKGYSSVSPCPLVPPEYYDPDKCRDINTDITINDPYYASRSDYLMGITRCDRDPDNCQPPGGPSGGGSVVGPPGGSGGSGDHTVVFPPPGNPGGGTGDKPGGDTGNKPGGTVPPPGGGSGSGSTDKDGNGDVVAAINAFHADNNKNHKELMDDLNKKPSAPDYTGMEGEFSSTVGGAMSGLTDSVKSVWDAGKAAFGEGLAGIDAMLPDIKTAFDLPPGFEAASTGRCIPVVLDFTISLVGIPDYHFHAVGTQVCLLYDQYIRPVLNFVLVILSFFVIHRLLVRSAEFLTDGRH